MPYLSRNLYKNVFIKNCIFYPEGCIVKKSLSCVFLTIMVVTGLMLVNTVYFRTVKASVNVTGVIGSDITWTKANSPYILTGNVLVGNGVTLTIEAGATVNLGSYYIMVNGTLRARGSVAEKVQSNGGSIIFTNYSSNWNEATGLGSIIENANLSTTSISIELAAPRIDSNSISA